MSLQRNAASVFLVRDVELDHVWQYFGWHRVDSYVMMGRQEKDTLDIAMEMLQISRKQAIYRELLHVTLPYLRNISTWSWWHRLRDHSAYYEAELIHNLPVSILEPEFVDHDIWFLNEQARVYCRDCNETLSFLYPHHVELIRELFSLVPEALRCKLRWRGPT